MKTPLGDSIRIATTPGDQVFVTKMGTPDDYLDTILFVGLENPMTMEAGFWGDLWDNIKGGASAAIEALAGLLQGCTPKMTNKTNFRPDGTIESIESTMTCERD